MAEFPGKGDTPLSQVAGATQKRSGPNISSSWVIMLLSGLIAMIVFLASTAKPNANIAVIAASGDIPTGALVNDSNFKSVNVSLNSAQLNRFIRWSDRDQYDQKAIAAGPIADGDLIPAAQLRKSTISALAAMSIPIDQTRAVAGKLAIGDRVSVIDESTGAYAATNIEVTAVNQGETGGALATAQSFSITVAVSQEQALQIGIALKNQKFDIIRTTGLIIKAPAPVTTTTTTTVAPSAAK